MHSWVLGQKVWDINGTMEPADIQRPLASLALSFSSACASLHITFNFFFISLALSLSLGCLTGFLPRAVRPKSTANNIVEITDVKLEAFFGNLVIPSVTNPVLVLFCLCKQS